MKEMPEHLVISTMDYKPSKASKTNGRLFFFTFIKSQLVFLHGFSLSLGGLLFLEVMRRYALACVLCFYSEHFFCKQLDGTLLQ